MGPGSSLRAFIIANCVEPGNDIGLNTSWAPTATELPMLFFTKATEMDLLVSCMGSGQQLLHYASVITGYGLRTRSHRHRHRTTSTAYFTFALLGPLLVDHLLAHRQHLSPAASRPLPGSSSASVSGGQPDRRALSLRSSASSSGRAFIQTPVIRLARAPQPMCGFAGVTKTTLVISSSTPTLMISSSSPQPMCGFAKVTNLATASQPLHRLQFCRHNSPVPSSPMRTLTPVCTPSSPVHWRGGGWHGAKRGQSAARIIRSPPVMRVYDHGCKRR